MNGRKQDSGHLKTVLIICNGMLLIFIIYGWSVALYGAITIGVMGALSGYLAEKISDLWMKLTWVLSKTVPNVLMTIIFFLLLTPLAFLSRIFGEKNPLYIKNSEQSLFTARSKGFDKKSFEKPW